MSREPIKILATGVRFFEHPDPEGALAELDRVTPEDRADLEAYRRGAVIFVASRGFVEFVDENGLEHRFEDTVHAPQAISGNATTALLRLASDEQLPDAELGIAGYAFTRFDFAAAPRRIDVDPDLRTKLHLD